MSEEMVPKSMYDKIYERHIAVCEEIGRLQVRMKKQENALLILKVRNRIEELERKFLPQRMFSETRRTKWKAIMSSTHPDFTRNQELYSFRTMITVSPNIFIETVISIYPDFSNKAAPLFFPIEYDEEAITLMLYDLGIFAANRAQIQTVETILSPIPLLPLPQD